MSHRIAVAARDILAILLTTLLAAAGGCNRGGNSAAPTGFTPIALERVFPALSFASPVAMLQAPGNSTRWYVVERGGRVAVFPNDAAATPAQVTTFKRITVDSAGEGGLLGLAFHPNLGGDREYQEVARHAFEGRFWPVVDSVVPLSEGREAFRRMADGAQFRKLVIEVAP